MAEERRSSKPLSGWWWFALIAAELALAGLGLAAWLAQEPRNHIGAVQVLIGLFALGAASWAAIYAIPELREWRLEHHRYAGVDLWIDFAQDEEHPGARLDEVKDEKALPSEPMARLNGGSAIVRACVHVLDRFALRDCVLNIVVPATWKIEPLGASDRHRLYPTVTPNSRVNPTGDHGCRFTVLTGDFAPKSHFTAVARIWPADGDVSEPIRLMVELDCTPALATDADRYRFALLGPANDGSSARSASDVRPADL